MAFFYPIKEKNALSDFNSFCKPYMPMMCKSFIDL